MRYNVRTKKGRKTYGRMMITHHKKGEVGCWFAAVPRRLFGDDLYVICCDYIIHHIYEFSVIEM